MPELFKGQFFTSGVFLGFQTDLTALQSWRSFFSKTGKGKRQGAHNMWLAEMEAKKRLAALEISKSVRMHFKK